jgi:hypothetical protein
MQADAPRDNQLWAPRVPTRSAGVLTLLRRYCTFHRTVSDATPTLFWHKFWPQSTELASGM